MRTPRWWDYPNKTAGTAGGSSTVFARPIPLTVGNASNVLIEDLTLINSPFWKNFVYQSDHVTYRNINISSHSYSASKTANSDGWDIYRSSFVTIEGSFVDTTDDCVCGCTDANLLSRTTLTSSSAFNPTRPTPLCGTWCVMGLMVSLWAA